MSGRKVFTSGEILTSADVNSYLMDQSVMVFADSTARSSAIPTPTEGMVTYLEDADELEVYTTDWGAVSTPGILQVVQGQKTDTASFSIAAGGVSTISGLSAAITPQSASNKILVQVAVMGSSDVAQKDILVYRDGSPIGVPATVGSRVSVSGAWLNRDETETGADMSQATALILDSPSTSSEITYTVGIHNLRTSTDTAYVNRSENDLNESYASRGVSKIILMEVAG